MDKQVDKKHYEFNRYVTKERFMSYYYQIKYISQIRPKSVLEIGSANNFLKNFFSQDILYKTLDIDQELKPDYVGSVTNIPLRDSSFDLVCCFQVLEHIPFRYFQDSLNELNRVSNDRVLISLPLAAINFKLELKLPLLKRLRFKLSIHQFFRKHKFNGLHYWEIGKMNYSLRRIKKEIEKVFFIEDVVNPYENPYHLFFRLKKK